MKRTQNKHLLNLEPQLNEVAALNFKILYTSASQIMLLHPDFGKYIIFISQIIFATLPL